MGTTIFQLDEKIANMLCQPRVVFCLLLSAAGLVVDSIDAQIYDIFTDAGYQCVLPFYYKGVEYTGCTKEDRDFLWCPITHECQDGRYRTCEWERKVNFDKCKLPVRIVGGRAEFLYRGEWGGICGLGFDDEAARAFCRDAGYHGGYAKPYNVKDKSYNGKIWLMNVKCMGHESRITECTSDTLSDYYKCPASAGAVPYANVQCYYCNKGACLNGGVCQNHKRDNKKGKCYCDSGFKGKRCEEMSLCGETLSEKRRFVCGARDRTKRNVQDMFLSESAAKSMMVSRKKRWMDENIIHECCDETCSHGEVEEYCENRAEENPIFFS